MFKRIILFNSTHQALKTEDRLRENGIVFEVVPLPKELSADCGLALEVDAADLEVIETIIKSSSISIKGIYSTD